VAYDEDRAEKVVRFVKKLRHTKGKWAGRPFSLLDWQGVAIRDIFGTLKNNGKRQYKMAYLEVPKKMGKSELCAALALYGLCADDEWSAEVIGAAADRAQASIIFDVATAMVDQNESLRKRIRPVLSQKRLVYLPTKSTYQVVSAEAYSKHGLNISMSIIDELHAQRSPDLFNVLTEGAGDAREQPLTLIVSTAGDDPDRESIGWTTHSDAIDILTGAKVDPTFYAMIYGIDKDNNRIWTGREYETVDGEINWEDPKIWEKVNPSIGHTVEMEKVVDQYQRAKGNLAREKNFRWLRLNSWEKIKTSRWLGLDFWDLCKDKVDLERLHGRRCYGGLDLSSKIDMTSFCLMFPPDDINKKWIVLPWFWLPEDNLADRVEHDKVPYDIWRQQGYLNTTPGNVIDYKFIEQFIIDLAGKYDIREIGYDPWNAMQTAVSLEDHGLTMVEVRQGFKSMSPPMKELEKLILSHDLAHGNNPVLNWMADNLVVNEDPAGNIKPDRAKSTEKIDGMVAMIMGLDRAVRHKPRARSVYETRGLEVA